MMIKRPQRVIDSLPFDDNLTLIKSQLDIDIEKFLAIFEAGFPEIYENRSRTEEL